LTDFVPFFSILRTWYPSPSTPSPPVFIVYPINGG
jgi:hypothetical protein